MSVRDGVRDPSEKDDDTEVTCRGAGDEVQERLSVLNTDTADRAADALDGTARPLSTREYLQSALDAEGSVALRLGPIGGSSLYYLYSTDGRLVTIERKETVPKTYGTENPFVESLLATYEPEFVIPEEIAGISIP